MTIITKAIGEKKPADKMERPLVTDTENSGVRSCNIIIIYYYYFD